MASEEVAAGIQATKLDNGEKEDIVTPWDVEGIFCITFLMQTQCNSKRIFFSLVQNGSKEL